MNMLLFIAWVKVKEFFLKYWQIFVGAFIALATFIKFWLESRAQKRILKNAIESEKKIIEINARHDAATKIAEDKAKKDHQARVAAINLTREEEKKAVELNRNSSNEDLANRLGETFGVDVVLPSSSSNSTSGSSDSDAEE